MLAKLGHQRKQGFQRSLLVHLLLRLGRLTFLQLLIHLGYSLLVPRRRSRLRGARGKLQDLHHHALHPLEQRIAWAAL